MTPSNDEIWAGRHQTGCNTYSMHVVQFGTAQTGCPELILDVEWANGVDQTYNSAWALNYEISYIFNDWSLFHTKYQKLVMSYLEQIRKSGGFWTDCANCADY